MGFSTVTRPTLRTALCHTCTPVWHMINNQKSFLPSASPLQLLGCIDFWMVLLGVPRHWRVPLVSGGHLPRLLPTSAGVGFIAPEAPLIRKMPMGPKVFLALPDACGLCHTIGTTLKMALCHIPPVVGWKINNQKSFLPSASPLQLLGHIAAGCFTSGQFCQVLPLHWRVPMASVGHFLRFLPPSVERFVAWHLRHL